jgi:hypothetical protein
MSLPSPRRRWQISAAGFPIGPHDEAEVIAAIDSGLFQQALCRPVGELRWRKLEEEPEFAEALRRIADTGAFPAVKRPRE